jgi:K+-transporting ATPase ATPase C chain
MMQQIKPAFRLFIFFTLLTGLVYPVLVTGIAQAIFPRQANGSILYQGDQAVGSALIGQNFSEAKYFWGRPSAAADEPYNASASGGTNYSVLNPDLKAKVEAQITALISANPGSTQPVPVDLVTASARGSPERAASAWVK